MGFDSGTAIFRQSEKPLCLSRVPTPPSSLRTFAISAQAQPESSIMNQRSSSIEHCFAYGALMDDLVALINKATTSNETRCVYNKSQRVFYPTDDVNVISVD